MDLSQLYTLLFCLWFLVLGLLSILFCALSGDAGSRWRINVDYRRTSRHTLLILLRLKEVYG